MKIKEIISILENWAPQEYAEDFDNVGLLVGQEEKEVFSALVALDTSEAVVEEAIEKKTGLIISFHPIIFEGLKKITTQTYVERVVSKAIKNDIAIYAIHTNLDNLWEGTHCHFSKLLDLKHTEVLISKAQSMKKLITYVPAHKAEILRNLLFEAGGGSLGNYKDCSFAFEGIGSFRGNENSNPYVGKKNDLHKEKEICLNMIFSFEKEGVIKRTLLENHPYEEPAYEIIPISNKSPYLGMGRIGELKEEMNQNDFLAFLKKRLDLSCIRYAPSCLAKKIKKVAFLGGSGGFAIKSAKAKKADVFISSDLKYHQFFESEDKLLLADIGHYESEKHIKKLISAYLRTKIPKFDIFEANLDKNPINYFF